MSLGSTNFQSSDNKLTGIYRGLVEDNNDPSQYGRIRVRIYPHFSGVDANILPWAVPAMPLFEGAGSGVGSFIVPEVGSYVFCFFEHGDVYQPVYFAEAQNAIKGLPTERTTNYPNRKVIKTTSGITVYIDDTSKVIDIKMPSAMELKVDDTNRVIDFKTPGNIEFKIDDINKYVDIKMPTSQEIKLDETNNTVLIKHSTNSYIQFDASGNITIKGTNVYINP